MTGTDLLATLDEVATTPLDELPADPDRLAEVVGQIITAEPNDANAVPIAAFTSAI